MLGKLVWFEKLINMIDLIEGLKKLEIPNLKWGITTNQVLDRLGSSLYSGPGILFYDGFELYFDQDSCLEMVMINVFKIGKKCNTFRNIKWLNKDLTLTKLLKKLCKFNVDFKIHASNEGLQIRISDQIFIVTDDVTTIKGDFLIHKIYFNKDAVEYPFSKLHACTTYIDNMLYEKLIEHIANGPFSINSWMKELIKKEIKNFSKTKKK
ncbi:MAG: hypothetical protein KTR26_21960 [Flammeovirgaceae bacterium]|nr:hypothetical protein [Flammeovirgaceae bacterium]